MTEFFRFFMIGLGNGAIYAMIGLGLVVIYRASGIINFAQGALAMLSTFIMWSLYDTFTGDSTTSSWFPLLLALAATMVIAFFIGAAAYKVVVQPVGDPKEKTLSVVIVTVGLSVAVTAAAQLIWGTEARELFGLFGRDQVEIFTVGVGWQRLGTLAVLAIESLVLWLIFQRTKLGLAMRSVSSNSESSALVGIPVSRILLISWGLAAVLGAVAGAFTAPDRGLDANLMLVILIYAFAAITIGGFDSLVGAVVGGLIVGVVTEVIPRYVGFVDRLPLAGAFVLMLLVLLFRPQGLFGRKEVSRV